jgi:hypothetical protein
VNWLKVVQNRDKSRACVDAVTKRRVVYGEGNSLKSSG